MTSSTRRGGTQPARARRLFSRDQGATLLPPDATISFAAERKAADVDEVFTALDNDLVGLVPVKKKVQEIAALLLVDRARRPAARPVRQATGSPAAGRLAAGNLTDGIRRAPNRARAGKPGAPLLRWIAARKTPAAPTPAS